MRDYTFEVTLDLVNDLLLTRTEGKKNTVMSVFERVNYAVMLCPFELAWHPELLKLGRG